MFVMFRPGSYRRIWRQHWRSWLGILSVTLAVALGALIVVYWDEVQALETYGYAGALVIGFLESAIIIVPIPAVVLVFALGAVLNPFVVGLAVGTGEVVGALTLYYAGRKGMSIYGNGQREQKLYLRLQGWMKRRGGLTLFLLSAILNPFFYPAGIAAGALRFPLWRFVLIVWAGKVIKAVAIAGAGSLGLQWLVN